MSLSSEEIDMVLDLINNLQDNFEDSDVEYDEDKSRFCRQYLKDAAVDLLGVKHYLKN